MLPPLVLADEPNRRAPFDLVRALTSRCAARLVLVVEPLPEGQATQPGSDGTDLAAACAVSAGAPVALPSYRATPVGGGRAPSAVAFAAADVAATLVRLVPPPFAVVAFVGVRTLPLLEALHADARTRPLLKLGVTGWWLDPDYSLAQKLVADGKLQYHEHGMSLERMLCRRLELMLRAHAARGPAGDRPPAAPGSDAVDSTA